MSEVVEPPVDETPAGPQSRLKKLTTASNWVSPFRQVKTATAPNSNKVSPLKQFQESNKVEHLKVPQKYTSHPVLEAETKRLAAEERTKKAEAEAKAEADAAAAAAKPEGEEAEAEEEGEGGAEPVAAANGEEEEEAVNGDAKEIEEPVTEAIAESEPEPKPEAEAEVEAEAEAEADAKEVTEPVAQIPDVGPAAGDDKIEEQVKGTPTELNTYAAAKYEPVGLPNKEVYEKLKDRPILLGRYEELNAAAIGSLSRSLDDPKKVIDLGSGLKMSQEQLLAIAAKRVAPVLANINDEVAKSRQEDEIKRQKELQFKVQGHERKLEGDFDKHVKKLDKQKEKFTKEIDTKSDDLTRLQTNAINAAATFHKTTKGEIETANTEYDERETQAIEKHGTDKETLIKNHDELLATKQQELEDAKTGQETVTQEIEALHEKKGDLDNKNSELSNQIEALEAELKEHTSQLDDLKAQHAEKTDGIAKNMATKEELDGKLATSKKELEDKQAKHDSHKAEIGVLAGTLAAYGATLATLHSEKEARVGRLDEAKQHYATWESDKQAIAKQVAEEHERKRADAVEAAETQRVQDELERQRLKEEREIKEQEEEEERERLKKERERQEQEEIEERERQEKKEAEERERKAKKDAEDKARLEQEQAEWEEKEGLLRAQSEREEEERLKLDPNYPQILRIREREALQKQLLADREESDRLYNDRKLKERDESDRLFAEIEDLKNQKSAKAEAERLEAERLAQTKAEEIQRLKEEHEAKLKLYQSRLEFEELQKQRLLEEVENLKKIRQLREEKARLETEVQKTSQLDDIQKLIEEREIEVAKLTKQIEFDDGELYGSKEKKSFLGISNDLSNDTRAIPDASSKDVAPPVIQSKSIEPSQPQEPEPKKESSTIPAVVAGGIAAGAAAVVAGATSTAAAASAPKVKAPTPKVTSPKADNKRSNSITKSFKSFFKSDSSPTKAQPKPNVTPVVKPVSKAVVSEPAASDSPVNLSHQPDGVSNPNAGDDDSWDSYSVYEEVPDDEFEAHKGDPNYLEVSDEDFQKHKGVKLKV